MSKKMKRVAVEIPPPPVSEDAKARLKHQALLQDYQDLQKEADDMRKKLDAAKERKLRLSAEVWFLRRRRKLLIEMKSVAQPQVAPPKMEKKRSATKGRNLQRKEVDLFKLQPLPEVKHKGKLYLEKETAVRTIPPGLDLNRRQTVDGGKEAGLCSLPLVSESRNRRRLPIVKEAAVQNAEPAINLNLSQQRQVGNDAVFANKTPIFDLNKDTGFSGKEATLNSRAPIFDLNEISVEEEELQNTHEPLKFEEPKIGLFRGGNEEQPNDLKLSVCRNAGEGSSRMGKRKISWQDPVALRV